MLEYAVVANMWTQNTKVMPIILPLIQKPPKKIGSSNWATSKY